jgi:hypothetical protein
VGLQGISRRYDASHVARLLALLERLMPMEGSYLQNNLGPFVVR